MNEEPKVSSVFRKRWFWIVILISAVLGMALALLFPVTSSPPM